MAYTIIRASMHGVSQDNYALYPHTHSKAKKIVKYKQALKYRHIPARLAYVLLLNLTVLVIRNYQQQFSTVKDDHY